LALGPGLDLEFGVGGSLAWNLYLHSQGQVAHARSQTEAALVKDLGVRSLISSLGGVYARSVAGVEPNPYLSHLPYRDYKIDEGPILTLVNSSYFMRLLHEHEADQFRAKVRGHVTSLRPLREENRLDEWERRALIAFHEGETEVAEVVEEEGKRAFRLMRPRYADEGCLGCHNKQGYQAGGVLGGVSISVPLSDAAGISDNRRVIALILGHTFL